MGIEEFEAVTLHRDGTFGLMYRDGDGTLRCSCGWPDEERTDERTWARIERVVRLHGEGEGGQ